MSSVSSIESESSVFQDHESDSILETSLSSTHSVRSKSNPFVTIWYTYESSPTSFDEPSVSEVDEFEQDFYYQSNSDEMYWKNPENLPFNSIPSTISENEDGETIMQSSFYINPLFLTPSDELPSLSVDDSEDNLFKWINIDPLDCDSFSRSPSTIEADEEVERIMQN